MRPPTKQATFDKMMWPGAYNLLETQGLAALEKEITRRGLMDTTQKDIRTPTAEETAEAMKIFETQGLAGVVKYLEKRGIRHKYVEIDHDWPAELLELDTEPRLAKKAAIVGVKPALHESLRRHILDADLLETVYNKAYSAITTRRAHPEWKPADAYATPSNRLGNDRGKALTRAEQSKLQERRAQRIGLPDDVINELGAALDSRRKAGADPQLQAYQ